jgi:response regulator NasT
MSETPLARIVIAEDEAIIRLDLKEILVEAGYEVVGECGRGDEAIALVKNTDPDLAILDIKMPHMDGLTAAKAMSGEQRAAVMLLTSFSQRDLIDEARDAGVAAYLVKPFRRDELLRAVADVLARAREGWAIDDEAIGGAEDKLATRRIVEEAKVVLMDKHHLDEPAAFAFIQRTAMDSRQKMRDVARAVINGETTP